MLRWTDHQLMGRRPKPQPARDVEGTSGRCTGWIADGSRRCRKMAVGGDIVCATHRDQAPAAATPIGPPPAWLPTGALAEWRRVVPILEERGVLTAGDQAIVVSWCLTVDEIQHLTATIEEVDEFSGGKVIRRHPAYSARTNAQRKLISIGSVLGLTPADRAKVPAAPRDDMDELEKLLSEKPN